MAVNQWDRGSANNGPNAKKKGNRTNSHRDPSTMVSISKQRSADVERWRKQAEAFRKKTKWTQERTGEVLQKLTDYINAQGEEERPITIAGLQLAIGCDATSWERMKSGEFDYRLFEFCELNDIDTDTLTDDSAYVDSKNNRILLIPYSSIVQKALQLVESQTEERLYQKGRVGDIFALKAKHGWQEDTAPSTVNQTLVIASEEQARKAIELLK